MIMPRIEFLLLVIAALLLIVGCWGRAGGGLLGWLLLLALSLYLGVFGKWLLENLEDLLVGNLLVGLPL